MSSRQRVLVIGASKGIGRAIAIAFGAAGASVAVGYHRDGAGAAETVELAVGAGGRAAAVVGDVSREPSAAAMVRDAASTLGGLDVVVHSAVHASRATLSTVDSRRVVESVSSNGLSFLWTARAAASEMTGPGAIVFLTSQGARAVVPDYGLIGPPKALAEAYARYLAVELAERAITVNVVECGPVDTESFRKAVASADAVAMGLARRTPAGRGVVPAEVGAVVTALAGPSFSMMTGQRVVLDGGLSLWA